MKNNSELIHWFLSLPKNERSEKMKSMKEFFQKNNKNILDLIQKFESFEEKPSKIIEESEKILQNNIILIEKIDSMERDINA
jgi:hypothetical protein